MENPSSSRSADEEAIRAIEAAYDQAWNRGDAKALVSSMIDDAIVVNPRGEVAHGKVEFERVISTMFAGEFKGTRHESTISRIHFPASEVAVVDGEASVISAPPAGRTTVRFTDVMVRRDGRWMLADVRAYVFLPGA
ncbi:MAG: SgcJ/EcaC family oxidoreductase [Deltaproteobacteria bacterium]|nr:SgcJ/EcaC family oxidoreductase [Deltaproteobacteria bacterium]